MDRFESATYLQNDTDFSKADSKEEFQSIYESQELDEELSEVIQDDSERIIYQLHYHNWSSHTCPFSNSLLQFRRRVRIYMNELMNEKIGPTIVHCRYT